LIAYLPPEIIENNVEEVRAKLWRLVIQAITGRASVVTLVPSLSPAIMANNRLEIEDNEQRLDRISMSSFYPRNQN
jgi:hypothetical protein